MVVLSYLVLKDFHIYVSHRCKNLASNATTMNLTSITPLQPFLVSLASVSYSSGKKKNRSATYICGHHYKLLISSRHYRGIFIRYSCVLVASGSILEEYAVFSRTPSRIFSSQRNHEIGTLFI
jgi:hypothetical protein